MSIRIEILDGTTPMLEQIMMVSHELALEALSSAGSKVQKEARDAMLRKRSPFVKSLSKRGRLKLTKEVGSKRELGLRVEHTKGLPAKDPGSMANFITSYLDEKNMLVVIGGRHKTFTPKKRDGGKVVGKMKPVKGIGSASYAILHMMNTGEEIAGWPKGILPPKKRAGYRFMQTGLNAARSGVVESLTKRYELLLHKAVNTAKPKFVKKVV